MKTNEKVTGNGNAVKQIKSLRSGSPPDIDQSHDCYAATVCNKFHIVIDIKSVDSITKREVTVKQGIERLNVNILGVFDTRSEKKKIVTSHAPDSQSYMQVESETKMKAD